MYKGECIVATCNQSILDLVQFNKCDVKGLIELSASVGWDYDEHEVGTVLSSGKIFGHKNEQGAIVSSAAIVPYDAKLASIGMVIVHKEYRGRGLGKEVTQKCIDSVSHQTSIMLISTEEGKHLYEKMGFIAVNYVHKFLCDSYLFNQPLYQREDMIIEVFNNQDFNDILQLDAAAFGDKRSTFLRNRINQSEKCLVMRDKKGNIIGYGMSILGPINLVLGPIVAPNAKTAALLVNWLTSGHQGKLRIDVPSDNEPFMSLLTQRGFKQVSQPPIMVTHSVSMPSRNGTLFGIAAQVFG
nr:GNAT family N-acetyltransferase [Metabacillus iocasae]